MRAGTPHPRPTTPRPVAPVTTTRSSRARSTRSSRRRRNPHISSAPRPKPDATQRDHSAGRNGRGDPRRRARWRRPGIRVGDAYAEWLRLRNAVLDGARCARDPVVAWLIRREGAVILILSDLGQREVCVASHHATSAVAPVPLEHLDEPRRGSGEEVGGVENDAYVDGLAGRDGPLRHLNVVGQDFGVCGARRDNRRQQPDDRTRSYPLPNAHATTMPGAHLWFRWRP